MKKIIVLLLFCLVIFVIVGCGVENPKLGNIYGKVNIPTIDETLKPMHFRDGIVINTVYLDGEKYTNTTPDGFFYFKDIPVGEHTLKVQDSDYISDEILVQVTEGDVNVTLDAILDSCYLIYYLNDAEPNFTIFLSLSIDYENTHKATLEIPNHEIFLDNLEIYTSENIIEINYYNVPFTDFNESLTVILTFYDEAENVLGSTEKNIILPDKDIVVLDEVKLDGNVPTFSWNKLDGIVSHDINLWKLVGEDWEWLDYIILNENSYTMETPLSNGTYKWEVRTTFYDTAGNFFLGIVSEEETFTVPVLP